MIFKWKYVLFFFVVFWTLLRQRLKFWKTFAIVKSSHYLIFYVSLKILLAFHHIWRFCPNRLKIIVTMRISHCFRILNFWSLILSIILNNFFRVLILSFSQFKILVWFLKTFIFHKRANIINIRQRIPKYRVVTLSCFCSLKLLHL